MKKNIIVGTLLAACMAGMSSCRQMRKDLNMVVWTEYTDTAKYGSMVARSVDAATFDKMSLSGAVMVKLRQGNPIRVTMKGNEKCVDAYSAKVDDGRLYLEMKPLDHELFPNDAPVITLDVTLPVLTSLQISGAASLDVDGRFSQSVPLDMNLSGAVEVDIDTICASDFMIISSGMGDLDMDFVQSDRIEVNVSGAAGVSGMMQCARLDISSSGMGDIDLDVDCSGELTTSLSGAADLALSGTCRTLNVLRSSKFVDMNIRHLKILEP